jgi:MtN3 and saliva related transmembrane protein
MQWIFVGIVAALLTCFSFVPQVIKMYRSKSVKDVSPITFFQFSLGASLWVAYGIHLNDAIIIASNCIVIVTLLTAIVLYSKYSRNRGLTNN